MAVHAGRTSISYVYPFLRPSPCAEPLRQDISEPVLLMKMLSSADVRKHFFINGTSNLATLLLPSEERLHHLESHLRECTIYSQGRVKVQMGFKM